MAVDASRCLSEDHGPRSSRSVTFRKQTISVNSNRTLTTLLRSSGSGLVLALASSGLIVLLFSGCSGAGTGGGARSDKLAAKQVRVVRAAAKPAPRVVTVTGTLAAQEQVVLGMKVAGRLAEINVDLGSRTRKGQTLARLAPDDFELRVRQAEAVLEQARARLGLSPASSDDPVDAEQTSLVRQARAVLSEARARRDRAKALWEQELLPRAELDEVEASFQVAEGRYQDAIEEINNRQGVLAQRRSEVSLARQQLADSVLTAPFDGAVQQRHASAGQYIAAGQPVVTLVRDHPLRLKLEVPERDAARLGAGQEVRLTVEGDPNVHRGRVARLSPSIEERGRTLMVEAEVPNPRGALRPGSFATATIVTSVDEAAIFLPISAIVEFAGTEKVIVAKEGKAVESRVRTGRRQEGQVQILEGVSAGDAIVVQPGNLVGGQPLTILN